MKLKTVSRGFFVIVVMALVANFAFLMLIRQAYQSAEEAGQRRTDTMRLVSGLQHETALLRRLVSAYTATADPRYLLYYYDVLAIREGSKPPPAANDPILYWEEVIAGLRPHKLPDKQQGESLLTRMQALDVSDDEVRAWPRCSWPAKASRSPSRWPLRPRKACTTVRARPTSPKAHLT
jgi:two-component system sensor histidine kinase/response regulator